MPIPVLPADIWIDVAQFIPHNQLCSMITVNRTFFHLAMDAKYHHLKLRDFKKARDMKNIVSFRSRAIRFVRAKFAHIDNTAAVDLELFRLRDPTIAHRVRKLRVVFGMDEREERKLGKLSRNSKTAIRSSLQENVHIMTESIACLANVTEFWFLLRHLPIQPEDLIPFLDTAWKTFGSNLRVAYFFMEPIYLSALLDTIDALPTTSLKELGFCFTQQSNNPRNRPRFDSALLGTRLAPFINRFAPTLHSLSFGSLVPVDSDIVEPSPLFPHLENIPNLDWLRLCMNCDGNLLSDPLGFTRFLRDHASALPHLCLLMKPEDDMLNDGQWEQNVAEWLGRNELDGVIFSNLLTLEIGLPGPAGFALTMEFVTRAARTLTKLLVHVYNLDYNDVDTLLSSLAHHQEGGLRYLSLRVKLLSPELVLLLAQKAPHLKELTLKIRSVAAQNGHGDVMSTTRKEELLNARRFAAAMKTCDIRHWGLQDVTILTDQCHNSKIGWKLMRVFADCIPSLQRFCDKDRESLMMNPDNLL